MLLLHITFVVFFLVFSAMYLRINNTKTVLVEEDESDTVLFYIATCIHLIAIAILFHSTHESLNSSGLIFKSMQSSFIEFWKGLIPVYGKIILTVACTIFVFTFLAKFFALQTLRITRGLKPEASEQEQQTVKIFITSAYFLGLVIVSYQYIESLTVSYVPILGGIN